MANIDYSELLKKLQEDKDWPKLYMFKFIITSDNRNMALVEALFSENAEISTMPSSKGKYTGITAKEVMLSPESVIAIYEQASKIEGIITL